MNYRLEDKEVFTVVGKSIRVTCHEGEHNRLIPKFWDDSHQDGTIAKIRTFGIEERLLGVCSDMQPNQESFRYMIASQTAETAAPEEGYELRTIPATAWAIFDCEGAMPGAIQTLFGRIFQEWFPATGYQHSGAPEIEVYPPGDTSSEDYRCEVWIPVVKK